MFEKITPKKRAPTPVLKRKNKHNARKKREMRFKEEEMLFVEAVEEAKPQTSRVEVKTEGKARKSQREPLPFKG